VSQSQTSAARNRLSVVVDASPLRDSRRDAGIGRYVASMLEALSRRDDLYVQAVTPRLRPGGDTLVVRWLNAQPGLALARARNGAALLHGMASEASLVWTPERQVVTLHDVIPWTRRIRTMPTRRYIDYQASRLRRCRAIIAVSETVGGEAIERLGLEASRVHAIPEGVGAVFGAQKGEQDAVARQRRGVPESGYVLWVGNLLHADPRKALDVLIDAMTRVGDATLVMAGAPGDESRRVGAAAAALGLRLILTGFVTDVELAALYRGAGAVAVPSLHEGFGLPLLEALACGAPVVATAAGNLRALAAKAAVLVPPGDANALADAISGLLHNPEERARLSAAGPEVAKAYSWDRAAEMTVAVYREVLTPAAIGK
jgi:glycosyltransferase involved in cell wall biosynthesis